MTKYKRYTIKKDKHTRQDLEDAIDKLQNHPEIPLDEILAGVFDEVDVVDEDESIEVVKKEARTIVVRYIER